MNDQKRKKSTKNYILIGIGVVVLILIILIAINWGSFAEGFGSAW